MAITRDLALILKRSPYGESSLVVQVLSQQHGRVHLLAKGAYRSSSRFFCLLDLFHTLELCWSESRSGGLATLREGRLVTRRRQLTAEPARYHAACTALELCALAARDGAPDEALFGELEGLMDALEGGGPVDPVLAAFELRFLRCLGLAPALLHCAACGREAPPVTQDGLRAAFSAGAGGRLCRAHAQEARSAGRRVGTLPVAVLDAGRKLLGEGPRAAQGHDPQEMERVRDFVGRFLDYHLETRPRTHRAFLAVPNRNALKSR